MTKPGIIVLVCVMVSGCVGTPPRKAADPAAMPMCYENEHTAAVEPSLLLRARVEAQRYSNEIYGADCVVCAEVLDPKDEDGLLWVHITSPYVDLINTSAAIWMRPDGKVVRKGQWHSCHARLRKSAS